MVVGHVHLTASVAHPHVLTVVLGNVSAQVAQTGECLVTLGAEKPPLAVVHLVFHQLVLFIGAFTAEHTAWDLPMPTSHVAFDGTLLCDRFSTVVAGEPVLTVASPVLQQPVLSVVAFAAECTAQNLPVPPFHVAFEGVLPYGYLSTIVTGEFEGRHAVNH